MACYEKSPLACHPERSEGSAVPTRESSGQREILRCAQDDTWSQVYNGMHAML